MKLSTLMRKAQKTTKSRGHSMRWEIPNVQMSPSYKKTQLGYCKYCGMEVVLNTHPAPNEIDIGGNAVALNCPPWRK